MQRSLRVETSDTDLSRSGAMEPVVRDDDLGANEDFWGSWQSGYAVPEASSDDSNSVSGSGEVSDNADDQAPTNEILQKAESVVNAALPFKLEHARSLLLPVGLVVAGLLVVAVAAVIIGLQRQHMSEPMFGPVELVSDLPDPMTTSGDEDESGSPDDDDSDTGVTILADKYEEEKEEEEEEFDVPLA
ncbi:hypothetical protein PHMEG_0002880 [Phytophthora megakarya]|uniref:Uncharacterized protein n=1 Tax=Phytophthora megakarya TaxID=4795 RepID=A0A225WZC9_9STRA|nr:hypothetical protein PHMEG_0002880 [Phytophthora megakarya]